MAAAGTSCVFCEIAAGRAPASVVYSDEQVIAFLDIRPVTAGHLLVVPRAHAAGLADLLPADGAAMFTAAQRLAAALRVAGLPCEGINLFLADGETAGQEVPHAHLHVLPRARGDGFRLDVTFLSQDRAMLDEIAGRVAGALGQPE